MGCMAFDCAQEATEGSAYCVAHGGIRTEIAQLRADLAAVRGACALALRWLGDPDDPNGTFEDIGAWYQRETGRLRPGKSLPMEMAGDSQEEREKHFRAWADAKDREVRAALKSAGGASRTERGDHAKAGK